MATDSGLIKGDSTTTENIITLLKHEKYYC